MRYLLLAVLFTACSTDFGDARKKDSTTDTMVSDTILEHQDESEEFICTNWYLDEDGDDYGTGEPICTITPPDGYVFLSGDCCDSNEWVNPAQDEYQHSPFYCPMESWDYNCDGDIDKEFEPEENRRNTCHAPTCVGTGWTEEVPDCGDENRYYSCDSAGSMGGCNTTTIWEGILGCR